MTLASRTGTGEWALEAEGLGKAYRTFPGTLPRALFAFGLLRDSGAREHWALRDLSFRLPRGGALGLVGANGAGKSTLLRVLSGTSALSEGRFRATGRIAALLELGMGFHPDFSGRENVILNGVLLGCTRGEMRRRLGAILEFSELGEAVDEPVRTYSTGMAMRLGFAVALGVEPEILLLDEVFAVGDLYFQKKCVDRLFEFRRDGGTLILCSHSLYDVRQMCDQALWLRAGRLALSGDAARVTHAYAAWQRERMEDETRAKDGGQEGQGGARPHLLAAELVVGEAGESPDSVRSGDALQLRIWWDGPGETKVHVGVTFTRQDLTLASGLATHLDDFEPEPGGGCLVLDLPRLELLAGTFVVTVILFDEWGVHRYHELSLPRPLIVTNDTKEVGLVRLEHRWSARSGLRPAREEDTSGLEEGEAA